MDRIMNGLTLEDARGAAHCPRAIITEAIHKGRIYHETVGGVTFVSPAAVDELRAMMAERASPRQSAPAGRGNPVLRYRIGRRTA